MPYLNLDPDFYTHPKTVRLIVALGDAGVTSLQRLWAHVAKHNPVDGVLQGLLVSEIAEFACWNGDANLFVSELVRIRFIEKHGENYAIHDWSEHQGHISMYHKRAVKAARKRWKQKHTKAMPQALLKDKKVDASRMLLPSYPNQPNQPNQPNLTKGQAAHAFLTLFHDKYLERWKQKPTINAYDVKNLQRLVEGLVNGDAERIIAAYFDDPAYVGHSLQTLYQAKTWDRMRGKLRGEVFSPSRDALPEYLRHELPDPGTERMRKMADLAEAEVKARGGGGKR